MEQFELSYTLALKYLSFRQRSEKEVHDYLQKKKFPSEIIAQVIHKLTSQKFLNDAEFARMWVENRNRIKPRSTWLLKRELSQKGIDENILDALFEKDSKKDTDITLAKQAIEKRIEKYLHLTRPEIYQKIGGFLARRGFDWDTSKRAIDDILKERYNAIE